VQEEELRLGKREEHRALVLNKLLAGQLTSQQAAELLGVSTRQLRRLKDRYRTVGVRGLVHGNRGRSPTHRLPESVRQQVVELAQTTYVGFNWQHLTEKLQEEEQLTISRSSVRRLLSEAGLAVVRPRRAPRRRRRRERVPQEGMLLQADGSRHQWLGPEGPYWTLVGGIDDATGKVPWAVFREQEDAAGYMTWLRAVAEREGLPVALYVDRHGIFKQTLKRKTLQEQLAGAWLPTQFGRVLQELGITLIQARSPQAKGRVERLWGTFQDRLVSELRLARVGTLDGANQMLQRFLDDFNRRFAVPAAEPELAYRPVPKEFKPEEVFCFKYQRLVASDNTVQFGGQRLQIQGSPQRPSYARAKVELHERLDGRLAVYYRGQCLTVTQAPLEAPLLRARTMSRPTYQAEPAAPVMPAPEPTAAPPSPTPKLPWKPAANHPWKRQLKIQGRTDSLVS
jgi:transposase